ncbi:hypothetical protein BE11_36035 [Sorangium cellulosum]|nr:hypothetical protein BE11_36035 [Sorangium cellulosum]
MDKLFVDAPCDPSTPLPLARMATCNHPPGTQRIEKQVTFGGDPGTTYSVKLRVRGIWEPTDIVGGEMPMKPFMIGGSIGPGDAINYQQYSIEVSEPRQTYWLNNYQYRAHDIHKEDYEATIQVNGGAVVKVVMNDGNERQIANWTKDYFEGLPPYDTAPTIGQMLRLDVVSVSE